MEKKKKKRSTFPIFERKGLIFTLLNLEFSFQLYDDNDNNGIFFSLWIS